jgi:very-short-patch-repair endonuclease
MPPKRSDPKTMHRAGELRRAPTRAETRLWAHLRGSRLNGVSFRRQHAIGPYIVDFCVPKKQLVIELDGSQHIDQTEYDQQRTEYLRSRGYRVLRFWNSEVESNLEAVLLAILLAIEGSG